MGIISRLKELRNRYGLRKGLLREASKQKERLLHRVTQEDIVKDLRGLGIETGDTVFVHSAFSKIGYVVRGAEAVIEALRKTVGEKGTILMPAFPSGGLTYEYVKRRPVFDVRNTPSDLGVIPETFRLNTSTHRSLHPTHSVTGWGHKAADLLEGHERARGLFAEDSPFGKFLLDGGKGIIIGARLHQFTTLRIIKEVILDYPYPVFCNEQFTLDVIDKHGRKLKVDTKVFNPALAPYRDGDILAPHLKSAGILIDGKIGNANSIIVDGRNLLEVLIRLYKQGVMPYRISPEEYRKKHSS